MSATIIDGTSIAKEVRAKAASDAAELKANGILPCLAVILVGDNPASISYVTGKEKALAEAGMEGRDIRLKGETTEQELLNLINELNKDPTVHGILVQLPLPAHIDEDRVIMAIAPEKDVDGFHPMSNFQPCTPKGIVDYLKTCRFSFTGLNAVIFGRSDIVGKPLAKMLTDLDMTVTLCHSKSKNVWHHISAADLIVVAVGKEKFLDCTSTSSSKLFLNLPIKSLL